MLVLVAVVRTHVRRKTRARVRRDLGSQSVAVALGLRSVGGEEVKSCDLCMKFKSLAESLKLAEKDTHH